MKLRFASKQDIPQLVNVGSAVHSESRFNGMPYEEEKLVNNLNGLLDLQEKCQTHCFILAENQEGEIIGGLIGAIEEYFFTNSRSANTVLLWVTPKFRGSAAAVKLIGAFREWAKQRDVEEVCILVASGVAIKRTDRFLRRLGFHQTGGNYTISK